MAPPARTATTGSTDDKKKTALIVVACAAAVAGLGIWARSQQRKKLCLQRKQLTNLRFDLSVEEIEAETERILARMKQADDAVAALGLSAVTFDNTAQKLIDLDAEMLSRVTNVTFLGQVSPKKDIRDACTKADEAIEDFSVQRGMRADVYKVVNHLYKSKEFQVRGRLALLLGSIACGSSYRSLYSLATGRDAPALRQEARAGL